MHEQGSQGEGSNPKRGTPRLSIVVPAYNVQAYLTECLDSVLSQGFVDFEVVCVDDCSPDHSGRILDAYARRDARVRVIHLQRNVGLGPARNVGIDHARGDYLMFLDSDDSLAPGALSAVARRLRVADDPDILIYDYARTYWDGRIKRNQRHDLLSESTPSAFAPDERPELLDLLQIVCNKAYRRDFVARHGFRFSSGYYEDTPWALCSLISAARIAVLDRVCLHYRQRRQGGSILHTVSRKHFDVFDQYDRVFRYIASNAGLRKWHEALFHKMVRHYLVIVESPGRLPENSRAEFFRLAADDYRRRRPAAFVRPGGRVGHKYALLQAGSYAAFVGMRTAGKAHRALRGLAGRQLSRVRRSGMDAYYGMQLRRPLDDELALFSAYGSRSYACSPAAIDAEVARLAPNIRRVWAVRSEEVPRLPESVETVRLGSREFWEVAARAKYCVNNVHFDDALVKREGSVHLQTHDGTPLATMGLDQRAFPASARGIDFDRLLSRCDRWDFSLSSNGFSTAIWERVYPSSFVSLETGLPRNDVLLRAGPEEVRRARRAVGIGEGVTALLYLSTRREHEAVAAPRLDLARLATNLGSRTVILVRGHHTSAPSPDFARLQAEGRIIDVSAHPTVEQLYLAADALVTDYAAGMFDYANLDRPIILHIDDWDVYRAVRGTYVDLMADPPGAVATTQVELTDILTSGEWNGEAAAKLRAAFRARFCDFDDGHAAERVVRRVFLGASGGGLPPVVPLDERRPAPAAARVPEPMSS